MNRKNGNPRHLTALTKNMQNCFENQIYYINFAAS